MHKGSQVWESGLLGMNGCMLGVGEPQLLPRQFALEAALEEYRAS